MLFNSYTFIFGFLPLALVAYFAAAKLGARSALATLTLASLLFYAWWNPPYVALIIISMLVDYTLGRYLSRTFDDPAKATTRKTIITVAIIADLTWLGYFKYANFFADSVNAVAGTSFTFAEIILPLGISFFTFEQVGYLVDAYHGKARDYSFLEYVFFVTFFPHLIAGPIIAHHQLLSQVQDKARFRFNRKNFATGTTHFIIGLFKKVVIADHVATYATPVFDAARQGYAPTMFEGWLAVFAYSLQLYFDFSGYSDMGLGLARMLNFKLPLNFNSPYKAVNIIDFWRRWHMTLSNFLRDYLYIPLGGNRSGPWRRHVNLLITMLLGGLWHGAGWGYVIWGALHGTYLIINHAWRGLRKASKLEHDQTHWLVREACVTLTFFAVMIGWVFFRAADWGTSITMLKALMGQGDIGFVSGLSRQGDAAFLCLAVYLIARYAPNSQELLASQDPALPAIATTWRWQWKFTPKWAVLTAALACAALLQLTHPTEFLYFQF